jgi:hypothetical protein
LASVVITVAKRDGSAMLSHHRNRLRQNKIAREGGYREALLPNRLSGQPDPRDVLEFINYRVNASRRDHLEIEAIAFSALQGITEARSAGPLEAEGRQRNMGLLAELEQLQPGIQIERHTRGGNLVEGGAPAVGVGKLDKPPHQFWPLLPRADRIAESRPGSPALCVHQEGIARIRKKKTLVTHPCEQPLGTRLFYCDAPRLFEVATRRGCDAAGSRTQQLKEA